MKEKFEIIPMTSVGPVKIDMSEKEVEQVMGKSIFERKSRKEYLDGFFVIYDSAGHVKYITVTDSEKYDIDFKGFNPLKISSHEALKLFEAYDSYDASHHEVGYLFIFKKLQMGLWRGVMYEDEEETIERKFEALGVGRAGYYP